jgi:hypothetical protein
MRTLLLLALTVSVGCAEAPPIDATVNVLTLKRREGQKIETPNVGVAVELITPANASDYKGITVVATWRERDQNQVVVQLASEQATKPRKAPVRILPLPLFVVRLANQSKVPVSFANAQLVLEDGKGKTYLPFPNPADMMGRVKTDIIGQYPGTEGNQEFFDNLAGIIAKQPFLDNHVVIQPGQEFQGYLAFKLDSHDLAELDAYLHNVDGLMLKLKNVQGEKPFDVAIAFDKAQVALAMTCPPGKTPSPKECKLKQ